MYGHNSGGEAGPSDQANTQLRRGRKGSDRRRSSKGRVIFLTRGQWTKNAALLCRTCLFCDVALNGGVSDWFELRQHFTEAQQPSQLTMSAFGILHARTAPREESGAKNKARTSSNARLRRDASTRGLIDPTVFIDKRPKASRRPSSVSVSATSAGSTEGAKSVNDFLFCVEQRQKKRGMTSVASLNSLETCKECLTNRQHGRVSRGNANLSRLLEGLHAGNRPTVAIA
jgi:hypothetical protein